VSAVSLLVTGYCDDSVCLIVFLSGSAELMKKTNGTYFPEEVAIIFQFLVFTHQENNLELCANCFLVTYRNY